MSDAFGPFAVGDKAVAIGDSADDPLMNGALSKGQTYTIRDWHIGHTFAPDGRIVRGQMVNVVGITGNMVPLLLDAAGQPMAMVEYGWYHTWLRKVWSAPESVAVAAECVGTAT